MVAGNHLDRLSRTTNVADALGVIRETDIGAYLEGATIRGFEDMDLALWTYFAERIAYIEAFKYMPADMRSVSRSFIVKYDVSNVKATLQGIVTGEKTPLIPIGAICDAGFLDELNESETMQDVADVLTQSRLPDFVPAIKAYDPAGGAKAKIAVESRLEGEYFHQFLKTASEIREGAALGKAYGLVIDLTNLGIACRAVVEGVGPAAGDYLIADGYIISEKTLRDVLPYKLPDIARRLDSPQYRDIASEIASAYDKSRSVTVIDEVLEKHKYAALRDLLSPRALSPLVMAWYLILKEIELRNLRLLLKAIYDGIAVEEVKRYLLL
ncbi:MAG: V-type ATPase subunit [Chloroflexi bacterium]|nr:V-type ATPase subunit [Chloroflexota bacterium]